jgi:hypothetical protein
MDSNTSLTEFLNFNRKTILVTPGADNNMTVVEVHRFMLDTDGQVKLQFDRLDLNSCQ